MSFAARLVHPVAIVAPGAATGSVDDYGQPVAGTTITRTTRVLIQPKTARELAAVSQGGVEFSDHTIYLLPRHLPAAGYIRDEPDAGRRFDIVGVRSFEFGRTPHLEVDAKLVGSTEGPTVEGS